MKSLYIAFFASLITLTSCKKDDPEPIVEYIDSNIDLPSKYEFDSRFSEGLSSVNYGGQTVRNLLVQDIKSLISNAATTPNSNLKTDVLNLYNYSDNGTNTITTAGSFTLFENNYESISTGKNLSGKINTTENVLGWSINADELFNAWLDTIDDNINVKGYTGNEIYLSTDSIDLNQSINKLLLGAVVYNQGTDNYLDKVMNDNNSEAKDGTAAYSVMEHTWDEAFGYFGAARNYFSFTDDDLASKNGGVIYKDDDADSKIDFRSEYNFGFSTNAGKRDRVINDGGIDPKFTTLCFEAFLSGRTAIANGRDSSEIRAYAINAANCWEKVIAATIIHYINDTKADLLTRKTTGTITNKYDLYKHWSELRGFVIALQYGSENYQLIDDADLASIATTVGNDLSSVLSSGDAGIDTYISDLDDIANTLRLIYNFDQVNVNNWRVSK